MPRTALPTPPPELLDYVGHSDPATQTRDFDEYGRRFREEILGLLPQGWTFEGKRVLDFGCGSGRVLRHFVDVGAAELHGCDVDGPSIDWLQEHLSPPLVVKRTSERPPLPYPDGHFDLIWSTAVLDSLAEGWSDWLLELHRVLVPGGLFITTFLGQAAAELVVPDEEWDEDRIGMNMLGWGDRWQNGGGPVVLHSPWWIRAHWGRAFEILELAESTSGVDGITLMRTRVVRLEPSDLEAPEPDEPRELEALRHNIVQLRRELARTGEAHNAYARQALEARELLEGYERSMSWRMTRPLRTLRRLLRRPSSARP